jgi:hypothetical protein
VSESSVHGTTIAGNGRDGNGASRVTFSDVARAHFLWDVAPAIDEATRLRARREFNDQLAIFEKQVRATIVEAYYCQKQASAVALAQREGQRGWLRQQVARLMPRREIPDFSLYRVTDWATSDVRRLADLLHRCDILAIKATWGLEGFQRAVVMQWLLAVEEHILGFAESEWKRAAGKAASETRSDGGSGREPSAAPAEPARPLEKPLQTLRLILGSPVGELTTFHDRTYAELNKIEDYYHEAGEKRGRLNYVSGMLWLGAPAVAIAAVAAYGLLRLFGVPGLHSPSTQRFFACMAAGAVGAVVSVLMRMTGSRGGFKIDHEIGKAGVRRLGAFRPLIGAVSGVVISFLLQTSLLPFQTDNLTIQLYIVVAFLAGFSERWTQVVLGGAMRTIEPMDDSASPPPGVKPARH